MMMGSGEERLHEKGENKPSEGVGVNGCMSIILVRDHS